ncbi:MAG: alginate lyase family protein [Clostridiaceae bacterium]|nr:alginate lyase family protein [Clostridiaceae bacterium]
MIWYPKKYRIEPPKADKSWIFKKADLAMEEPVPHITDIVSEKSEGGPHDYYSNGDYWWPNPDTPDGLPYVHRDGQTNPDNFNGHRVMLRHMRTNVVFLTAAYELSGDKIYSDYAARILKEFFLDEETKMNPNLNYAQALLGICPGRGIGIIDTLHLVDVVFAVQRLKKLDAVTDDMYRGLQNWFGSYLGWMLTSANGMKEMNADNNHGVCFFVQAAAFALFTDNERIVDFCRDYYKNGLMKQMAPDGSFPRELGRTKPYNYSIFVVDNMVSLCQMLSKPDDDLWEFTLSDGRGIKKGLDFITPYIINKSVWPYPPDVMHFDAFPARASFMVFAGCSLGRQELLDLYESLPIEPEDEEARRNIAVRLPDLWM